MKPTIGRIVHYALGSGDVEAINGRAMVAGHGANQHFPGQIVPMIIVKVWSENPGTECVNGQVFYDGGGTLWVTSRLKKRPEQGTLAQAAYAWDWPGREE